MPPMRSLLPLLAACAGPADTADSADPPFDPALAATLQASLDTHCAAISANGCALGVQVPGEPRFLAATGLADAATGRATDPADTFRIGSITKSFVAAWVLQLEAEGRLSLDDPLAAHLPDAPHADRVTLAQLLDHTAAYEDYVRQGAFLSDLGRSWTPAELVAIVADMPLEAEPGVRFEYSNTHFVLLALAAEAASGETWGGAVEDRFTGPLGMGATSVPSAEGTLPTAHGYLGGGAGARDVTTEIDPSGPWASGEIIADAGDLLTWGEAAWGAGLLTPAQAAALSSPRVVTDEPPEQYGLATYIDEVQGQVTVGHSGSTHGFQSRLRVLPGDPPIIVATLVNSFTAEADEIDAAIWAALDEAGVLP